MAPRIRLSISKPLPTIREAHEEALEDLTSNPKLLATMSQTPNTSANSDSYSSEDYIQSICHLARPTFPCLPETSCRAQDRKILKTLEDMSWSPTPVGTRQGASKCKLTNFISNVVPLGKLMPVPDGAETNLHCRDDPLAQIYTRAGKLCYSTGPLSSKSSSSDYSLCTSSRYLDAPGGEIHPPSTKGKATEKLNLPRAFGFPRLPSPRPVQKEMVCSELKCLRRDDEAVSGSNHGQKENGTMFIDGEEISPCSARGKRPGNRVLHCSLRKQSCLFKIADTDEKEERESPRYDKNVIGAVPNKQQYTECFQVAQKPMVHNWISEHRCIWKEAKLKACLLPAIAEV
ncbi:uncharacterized protein LOC112996862 [Dromaius novaehollandiae]|uniref:uncharacterized protein LOC112996862 n=1 Tax=Dromaius novaehollandiae TaxID=8790 RepID=UPI00311D7F1E